MPTSIHAFAQAGTPVEADSYLPADGADSGWTLVVCPGYGSIKDLMTDWGEALASEGHRVLVVGYRGYGDEPGQKGRIFPDENLDDARAVVHWARQDAPSRRIAMVGVSYGGAMAITCGADTDVDAVVSIVGYGSGYRHLRATRRYHEWLDLLDQVAQDRLERSRTGVSKEITLDEVLMRDAHAAAWRRQVEEEHPRMRFDLTVESVDRLLEFRPEDRLPYPDGTPLMIVHTENDHMVPLEEAYLLYERAEEPKELVVIPEVDHHDVHHGPAFTRCIDEICRFLAEAPARRLIPPPA